MLGFFYGAEHIGEFGVGTIEEFHIIVLGDFDILVLQIGFECLVGMKSVPALDSLETTARGYRQDDGKK